MTQAIGRAAYWVGFEGLLVPSATLDAHANLVVFTNHVILRKAFKVKKIISTSGGFDVDS